MEKSLLQTLSRSVLIYRLVLMWMWHNLTQKKNLNHHLTKEILDLSLQKETPTMIKNSTLLVKLLVREITVDPM